MIAQTTPVIDSLEKLVSIQKDTNLVKTYNELTWQYRNISREKALDYGNKALELAQKWHFDKGIAQAYNDMGIIYFDQDNHVKALEYYKNALDIRNNAKDIPGMAALYNKIGILYQRDGKFDSALQNQQKALSLYESISNKYGIATSLNNIGIVHQNMGNLDEALQYQEKSIAIKEEIKDKMGVAGSLINVANIYLIRKDFKRAEENYLKAENITRLLANKEYLSNALNNLGSFYVKTGQYEKALAGVQESYMIRKEMKDTKGMVSCMINLSEILTLTGKLDSAGNLLNNALSIADTTNSCRPELPRIYKQLALMYEAKGDFKNALMMQRKYSERNDSLYTDDLKTQFAKLQTQYETAKKEQTIQQQQFEITRKNYWLVAILAFFLIMGIIGYSIYHRNKMQEENRLQLAVMKQQDLATKAVIEAEENERKRIAGDLHDGVGQMMSAAKMNLSGFENRVNFNSEEDRRAYEKIIALVDESCKEVRNVSHNMMPNALLKRGLSSAVKEFIDKIDSNILQVNLHSEGLNERLDSNVETVLYRVIQECVNNVIKHSGANALDISLIKDKDGISATIEDNGKGFDKTGIQQLSGIGLKNIQTRIEYLKGTVDFDSAPGKGTLVAIHVPLIAV